MNYIGSKFSLINFIKKTIEEVTGYKTGEGLIFADLFAGTGVVGESYRRSGFKVISNDIQYYSYVLNKYFIENKAKCNLDLLDELNNLEGIEGFIYNNYCAGSGSGRNYFTDENGKKCDAIRAELESWYQKKKISNEEYFYFLASLINSIDKYANTASVYGAFLKHIKKSAQKSFSLELLPYSNGVKGEVYNQNANDLIYSISGDILYLDPPYNGRQYCTNYHVLETIARYDNPEIKGKTGLRDYRLQKSKYCSKKTLNFEFEELIKNAKFKYIFLSYNDEGLMGFQDIRNIMSRYGKYFYETQVYRRFKADRSENRNILKNETKEYIHCLIKE